MDEIQRLPKKISKRIKKLRSYYEKNDYYGLFAYAISCYPILFFIASLGIILIHPLSFQSWSFPFAIVASKCFNRYLKRICNQPR